MLISIFQVKEELSADPEFLMDHAVQPSATAA
jgi:hypothetical protein